MKKDAFLAAVEATIRDHHMLQAGDTVVTAVSGGPDSVALLHTLANLSAGWSLRLVVAHLNHKLRGAAADEEAAFVARLSADLNLPCEIRSTNAAKIHREQRRSLQEVARDLRYTFYGEVAEMYGAQKIALGHQAEDNAESVLMHLLRGAGPRGLSGIPPVRDRRIIRPLIQTTRQEILDFLARKGWAYVKDQSNLDRKYLRNRIRHELLPCLQKQYNRDVVSALNRLAAILRDEENFWEQEVKQAFDFAVTEGRTDAVVLSGASLSRQHPALLRRVIRRAVSCVKGDLRRLGHTHVEAVSRLITGPCCYGRADLPGGVRVERDREKISFLVGNPEVPVSFEYDISCPATTRMDEIGLSLRLSEYALNEIPDLRACPEGTALFDRAALCFPLKVRNFRPGDRFRPLGLAGTQKLKAFFINEKVPRAKRRRCPILLSRGDIIWVAGYRIADPAKITDKTKRVVKAELLQP